MSERYFCESSLADETVILTGPEAHHLASVMRAALGDRIILFNGAGIECEASVLRLGKREVELHIEHRQEIDREATRVLTLGVAFPKGDRQKWLIAKAVELGVSKLIPIVTQRSVVKLKESGIERARRTVIEASKQCGRNRLMAIEPSQSCEELIRSTPLKGIRVVAHPSEASPLSHLDDRDGQEAIALVGPEGGFTDKEIEFAIESGWRVVSLGERILRVETAALKLAALLLSD